MKQYTVTELLFFLDTHINYLNQRITHDENNGYKALTFADCKDRNMMLEIKDLITEGCNRCKRCNSLYKTSNKRSDFCTDRCRIAFFRSPKKKWCRSNTII